MKSQETTAPDCVTYTPNSSSEIEMTNLFCLGRLTSANHYAFGVPGYNSVLTTKGGHGESTWGKEPLGVE